MFASLRGDLYARVRQVDALLLDADEAHKDAKRAAEEMAEVVADLRKEFNKLKQELDR